MAASLILRTVKGTPLTNLEVDNNFSNLNTFGDVVSSNIGVLSALTTTAKSNIVFAVNEIKDGNLSQFASTTSAELASIISDETGSGALVFANSPTLVTPLLGTPTSGNLINATDLPIVAGTTGTLSIARGGTGTTSTTFANLTTNVTGTLPIANGGTGSTSTTFVNLATNVTGTLPIANGGTGATSAADARIALNLGTANNVSFANVTSTGFFLGDGSLLSNLAAGGGSGLFNTAISSATGYAITTSMATAYTAPATAGLRYVVHSIHVTNIDGVNSDNVSGQFSGTTYSSISFATNLPVPAGSSVELLKKPKVLQPGDVIQLQAGIDNDLHATITIEPVSEAKLFGAGIDLTTGGAYTTLHTATANSVIESILLSNDDAGAFDVKASVVWTNAADAIQGYFTFDLIVPNDATVEVLEQPKFLPSGFKVRVLANQADRLEAVIAGKTV